MPPPGLRMIVSTFAAVQELMPNKELTRPTIDLLDFAGVFFVASLRNNDRLQTVGLNGLAKSRPDALSAPLVLR